MQDSRIFCGHHQIAMSDSEHGLSFSARDLLIRLVREDRSIRGRITTLCEPLWVHRGGYPEPVVQLADVRELLQHGLIEFSSKWSQRGEELYKASTAGIRAVGQEAAAHVQKVNKHEDQLEMFEKTDLASTYLRSTVGRLKRKARTSRKTSASFERKR